jgi:hypothetical protein
MALFKRISFDIAGTFQLSGREIDTIPNPEASTVAGVRVTNICCFRILTELYNNKGWNLLSPDSYRCIMAPGNLKDTDNTSAPTIRGHGGMIHEDSTTAPEEGCFNVLKRFG